jgi:Ricin-type beta-trefoil lectin domain-like
MGDNFLQHWFIDETDDGYYYLRDANSNKYMTGGGRSGIVQSAGTGAFIQQWQFVRANPASSGSLAAHYEIGGNAADSAGTHHGVASGKPGYTAGTMGQAIQLDGADDYVMLPSGVAGLASHLALSDICHGESEMTLE